MTGGTAEAAASSTAGSPRAAAEHGIALVLGSGRAAARRPGAAAAPTGPAGAGRGRRCCSRTSAPRRCAARAAPSGPSGSSSCSTPTGCPIHLNPRAGGGPARGRAGLRRRARRASPPSSPGSRRGPVVVKEVGFGLDPEDVAAARRAPAWRRSTSPGAGGTNWALIEGRRDPRAGAVAAAFADWGTADRRRAGRRARRRRPGLPVIASGGLRDGVDVAKCLALGASAGGLARPFLIAAQADRAGEAVRHGDRAAARSRPGRPARRRPPRSGGSTCGEGGRRRRRARRAGGRAAAAGRWAAR